MLRCAIWIGLIQWKVFLAGFLQWRVVETNVQWWMWRMRNLIFGTGNQSLHQLNFRRMFGPKSKHMKLVPFLVRAYNEHFTSTNTYKSLCKRLHFEKITSPSEEKTPIHKVSLNCNWNSMVSCTHDFEECWEHVVVDERSIGGEVRGQSKAVE